MNLLGYIILFTLIGSIFSLIGGVLLLLNKKLIMKFIHILSSFAAGALLGAVFFELLPEGVHQAEESMGIPLFFFFVLGGVLLFYLLERVIHWQHTHDFLYTKEPIVPLIVIGDTVHNFVDGIAIASAFFINIPFGIITALVVGLHEIPQEIGDFGVLLKKGLKRKTVLLINLLSAAVSLLGAIVTFYVGRNFENLSIILIAISSGFFLYISLSNLIPEIHVENRRGFALGETLALIGGIAITYIAITTLHSYLPTHSHEEIITEKNHEISSGERAQDYMHEANHSEKHTH